jgi:formate hydrogenlyase transcriptional activator
MGSPKTFRNNASQPSTTAEDVLRLVVDTIPALIVSALPNGSVDFINQGWREYTGLALEGLTGWGWNSAIHPEDLPKFAEEWDVARAAGQPFENEARVRRADGEYRWFLIRKAPLRDDSGTIVKWYGTGHDIEDLKLALEKIRKNEFELQRLIDLVPVHIIVQQPDGSPFYTNRVACEYTGLAPDELYEGTDGHLVRLLHPDDLERERADRTRAIAKGVPWESEARIRGKDGRYRSFLIRVYPLRGDTGEIIRWYATGTDIEDRKQAEDELRKAYDEIKKLQEQLYKENLALKEEIDRSSMFEEIVGASPPLQEVLSRVSKVAPTESTVLITGETGTGKELVARAVHKRSARSKRAFVSVNCAAIPQSLLASELFGHEKGAFTGALQRRLGRFELADGGTIFLDEIGELPTETQIALLRVLQEREFERVGGNQSIKVDVRVIAATNRDLQAAIDAGTFRSDLFYRLNVFPIAVPPLRERTEDIPMLVEYFLDRYASKTGKKIRGINRKTLDRLISYPWPGNIRELQNVIERSVILCETENFSVDASWLPREANRAPQAIPPLAQKLVSQEKEIIEAALAESKGRVSGASGAAAKLGIPPSTLESKIRSLKINKHRFV